MIEWLVAGLVVAWISYLQANRQGWKNRALAAEKKNDNDEAIVQAAVKLANANGMDVRQAVDALRAVQASGFQLPRKSRMRRVRIRR